MFLVPMLANEFKTDCIPRTLPPAYLRLCLARPMFEVLDFASEQLFNLSSVCLIISCFS